MKFNWGHGILVVLILFFIGLGTMVYISMKQDHSTDLIEDNYYEKELVFQEQIDGETNLANLYPDSVFITNNAQEIFIKLPGKASGVDSGFVEFIRPSDKTKDRMVRLLPNNNGEITIPAADFIKGLYRFRIRWMSDGITYVKTKDFILN